METLLALIQQYGLAFVFVNVLLLLTGVLAFVWDPPSRWVHTAAPSIHVHRIPAPFGRPPAC